jgi:hypothetical protein
VVSPELAHVLSAIMRGIRGQAPDVPLVAALPARLPCRRPPSKKRTEPAHMRSLTALHQPRSKQKIIGVRLTLITE